MIVKCIIKPFAMVLAIALFSQQAYGDQLQDCISGAHNWENYQIEIFEAIYVADVANIIIDVDTAEGALAAMVVGTVCIYFLIAAIGFGICAFAGVGAGPCYMALSELLTVGYQAALAIVAALLITIAAVKAARLALALDYKNENFNHAALVRQDEIAVCHLQYGN